MCLPPRRGGGAVADEFSGPAVPQFVPAAGGAAAGRGHAAPIPTVNADVGAVRKRPHTGSTGPPPHR